MNAFQRVTFSTYQICNVGLLRRLSFCDPGFTSTNLGRRADHLRFFARTHSLMDSAGVGASYYTHLMDAHSLLGSGCVILTTRPHFAIWPCNRNPALRSGPVFSPALILTLLCAFLTFYLNVKLHFYVARLAYAGLSCTYFVCISHVRVTLWRLPIVYHGATRSFRFRCQANSH